MAGSTTIRVKEETADELHARKCRGETYNDVLVRELDFLNTEDNE